MLLFTKHGVAQSMPVNRGDTRKGGDHMKNSAKFGMDACGGHDSWRRARRRLLQRWATLNSKLYRKEFFLRWEMKLTVLCLFVALAAGAQSTTEHLPVTDAEKIADALRAAPKFITDGAIILDWPAKKGGEFRVLRQGSSEWTCLPGPPPGDTHDEPGCFDKVFFQWATDGLTGRPQHIDRLGIAYMYTGAWVPNWPGETAKKEFRVGPHIMVVTPHPDELQGFSRDGWNGTYVTHLPGTIMRIYCSWLYRLKRITGERVMQC
jgi:hypothetical protein